MFDDYPNVNRKSPRERVAEAICTSIGDSPYNWPEYLEDSDAAIKAMFEEPEVQKWPLWMRLVLLLTIAILSWVAVCIVIGDW